MKQTSILSISGGVAMGLVGVIMTISSVAMLTAKSDLIGAYLGPEDRPSVEDITSVPSLPNTVCVEHLEKVGFRAEVSGEAIQVPLADIADIPAAVGLASMAAMACPGFHLTQFCMGEECGTGMEMTLEAAGRM